MIAGLSKLINSSFNSVNTALTLIISHLKYYNQHELSFFICNFICVIISNILLTHLLLCCSGAYRFCFLHLNNFSLSTLFMMERMNYIGILDKIPKGQN